MTVPAAEPELGVSFVGVRNPAATEAERVNGMSGRLGVFLCDPVDSCTLGGVRSKGFPLGKELAEETNVFCDLCGRVSQQVALGH